MKHVWLMFILLMAVSGRAQQVLTNEEVIAIVKKFHPVAKSAQLGVRIANATVLSSRGAFDPVFKHSNAQKEFGGLDYYNERQTELKVPTWYGIDLYAGTEYISGGRVSAEKTLGAVSYVGASMPVLQNLLFDKRRAALQQAKWLVDQSEAEQRAAVNTLLRDALHTYWEWWEAHQVLRLVDSSLANATARLSFVRKAHLLGDRAAIDTVEALTQVQTFEVARAEAISQLQKAQFELSAFLWRENNEPYGLPDNVVPADTPPVQPPLLDELLTTAALHPDIQKGLAKIGSLRVERRLKFQSLLPKVEVKYNQLGKGYDIWKTAQGTYFQNNYRYGLNVSVPLRLSEGRGEYQKSRLKLDQAVVEQSNKQIQVQVKVKQYYTEWQQTLQQLRTQVSAVANYATLQRGEDVKFNTGESSLFLVNAREQKTLEARQKLVQLEAKNRRALASLRWAAGVLGD
jgi:outer membrane protein TolC